MVERKILVENIKFTKIDDRFIYDLSMKCPDCGKELFFYVVKYRKNGGLECPHCKAKFEVKVGLVLVTHSER